MLGTVTDEDLVAKALKGSNSAWTKLVKRYEKRVYNYALRMVGHPDDAFDLMQEVFVGVHRNLAGFRGDGAFPAWLFRIANFRCTDYLRRRRQTEEYDDQRAFANGAQGPEEQAFTTHTNEQIAGALAKLPNDQRQVVELKFFQHFTFEDIAGQLGISPNTAKTRLYSALKKLKQHEELRDAL
ncbi:MAG: sigma-70 family RNA polymerase sigma factor [Pseudomonadales bacterium]|nr:sigma-70 family RNA polymerase sigma factor [Pseudomonadales bacterium]